MTKRDAKTLTWATLFAAAFAGGLYWWGARKRTIVELSPVQIQWESA